MAESNISKKEKDIDIDNLPSLSVVLTRERSRLEKSLSLIDKTLSELEFHDKRHKMDEKAFQPHVVDESSSHPFLGFTPQSSQPIQSYQPGLRALQENIGAQSGGDESSFRLASVNPEMSINALSTNDGLVHENFDASGPNATFSIGLGRGRLFATPQSQQVNNANDLFTGMGVRSNEMRRNTIDPRFASNIHHDTYSRSNDRNFDDRNETEDPYNLDRFRCGSHGVDYTRDWNSLNLPNVPVRQSTGLLPQRQLDLSPIGNEYVPFCSQPDQRDSWSSTKVELQNVPLNYHRSDDNYKRRMVHFNQDERQHGQRNLEHQQVDRSSAFEPSMENRRINAMWNDQFNSNQSQQGYDQFQGAQGRSTMNPNYAQSTPYNDFNLRQRPSDPNFGPRSSSLNFSPGSHGPTSQQQSGFDNVDIMTKLVARQVIGKELPNFSGDPEDWSLFHSQYMRTTMTCHYTGEENIFRLRKCLKGDAMDAVRPLLVSPNNSQAVMRILEKRFGRPDDIIKALVKKVNEVVAPREDKPRSIVAFSTAIQNLVATLENLEREDHLRNPILLNDLERKLPTTLCLLWSEYVVDRNDVTLKTFGDWMQRRAEAASRRFTLETVKTEETKKDASKAKGYVHNIERVVEPKISSKGNCRICNGSCQKPWRCEVLLGKDVNQRWNTIKEKKLCFSCLSADHNSKNCTRPYQCGIDGCQRTHNKVLHTKVDDDTKIKRQNNIILATVRSIHRTNLRILPVIVSYNDRAVRTFALLDNGSQSTLVSSTLVTRLGIIGTSNPIILQWPNGDISTEDDSQIVSMNIRGTFNGAKTYTLYDAQTAKKLNLLRQTINREELVAKFPYLQDVEFESFENVCPELLIGENNCLLTVTRQLLHDVQNTPIASRTCLGWTISGNDGRQTPSLSIKIVNMNTFADEDLHNLVKSSFAIDDSGIKEQPIRSKEDLKALQFLETKTQNIGGRWQTGLLWRNPNVVLPESRTNAYHRLLSLERKFDKDPELFVKYEVIINSYIEKNYLRKVTRKDNSNQRSWYLPHFPVKYPLKPGKIRVVFDAASKSHGTSLNDNLVTGPDFLKLLAGVLFRFRQRTIGFIGDIKDMFHRVLIQESDIKCQKILWRGRERNVEPDEYEMTVMMFGATCSPSSAIYVKNLNAQRYEKQYPEAVNAIINKHYMDDYLDSKFSVEEAIKIINEVIYIHKQGSFEICNWISSSKEVMAAIPEHLRRKSNTAVTLDHENLPGRVLGVLWKPEEDVFTFSSDFAKIDQKLLDGKRLPTKREVLKVVNSIYDPLGFVAHFVITGRIILKSIWRSKIDWDQTIPENVNQDWQLFLKNLKNIGNVQIDRCYSTYLQNCDNIQLHVFGDSSNQAYCAIAFMRIQRDHEVHVKFITAKTRVTPLKENTDENIHRFELQAALLVSRLSKFVLSEHEIDFDDCFYWTDSMAVWYWIHSETKRYKQFVANRLNEILESTDKENWNWLPSDMNVADDGTRFGSVDFISSNRWYNGPDFLYEDQSKWPEPKHKRILNEDEDWMEVVNVGQVVQVIEFTLPNVERFSNWRRLIGATAWMLRYINNCNPNRNNIFSETLGVDEMQNAELKWILHSQQRSFANEISDLKRNNMVVTNSRIYNLSPEIDENGILRLCGRADRLPESTIDQRRPIILDGQDGYSRLLIRYYHEKYNHIGHETVLNEIKQRFWILKATVTLKKIRSECWKCRIMKAKPKPTIMGQLPEVRLEAGNPAFHFTGMDYFGPISIKIGRQIHKRYGVLFTCLTVRAVHIEVAASETTDSCIMAIRRFISRRGCPQDIYSDNGSNLRGSDNALRATLQALDQDRIRAVLTTHRINWHFNPPTASHMGGSWERLVGSIKKSFYATLNTVHPTEEMLATLLAEAEHMVNSRPLLELSNDPNEPETLTPNHFLIGRSSASAPIGIFDKDDLILKKQWRAAQHLADLFWKRWMKEYRPTLTKRTKWFRQARNPRIGELVYLADDNQPRGHWPRGIITNVFPGKDGQIRVVDVTTNKNTYRRPLTKVCLFDLN